MLQTVIQNIIRFVVLVLVQVLVLNHVQFLGFVNPYVYVLFILSGVLMLENAFKFMLPLFVKYVDNGYMAYVTYIHNNWVVLLLIAAIIEIYTTHRISYELKKENAGN